jgi:hypothetical protein
MAFAAEILHPRLPERQAREDRHPVIGLLAVNGLMDIAQLGQGRAGEEVVGDLGFLQSQHIRLYFPQKTPHQGVAVAHGIDIPGGDFHLLQPFHAATAQQVNSSCE